MNYRPRPNALPIALCLFTLAGILFASDEVLPPPEPKCAAGCSVAGPPAAKLGKAEIARCLGKMAVQPAGETSLELETLLFHAGQVIPYLKAFGQEPLKPEQSRFLKRELARNHAHIRLRVVDGSGKKRMTFDRRVPIGVKQHLHPKAAEGFVPPEISFTVHRVGLRHLWTRL